MVAAWMKIAILVLKVPPVSKKQRPYRQNAFSEHQSASTADAPIGAVEFCKKLTLLLISEFTKYIKTRNRK